MKITQLKNISAKDYTRIMRRSFGNRKNIKQAVAQIIENVAKNGDSAIFQKYQTQYGKFVYTTIAVSPQEIAQAYKNVDTKYLTALRQMMKNIQIVQQVQLPSKVEKTVLPQKGIRITRLWRPIESVGLYIPGGSALYPSSVFMSAIPALIAGCQQIVLCSPPRQNGAIPAQVLVAADMIGIKNIYKVGGVEAIAAMAYGTQTIPKVFKIFGPGNSYVTEAKLQVYPTVAIDMPAGPSEVLIIADGSANPAFIAADLLADGEHGPDSASVLLTTSQEIARKTADEIEKQLGKLSTAATIKQSLKKYGLIAVVNNLQQAIDLSNDYAPEHLELMTRDNVRILKKITNAGSVFIGPWTSKSSGDYATGANHILPTGTMAKMYPPLGVDAFGKWMQVQECSRDGLAGIRKTIEVIADVEQLPAHKRSTTIRFENL